MGGTENETVIRSKKRHFLMFFINRWLPSGYEGTSFLYFYWQKTDLRKVRFHRAKDKVSSCERLCFRRWNMTFGAVKAYVSRCESYAFVKLGMKNEEWRIIHEGGSSAPLNIEHWPLNILLMCQPMVNGQSFKTNGQWSIINGQWLTLLPS